MFTLIAPHSKPLTSSPHFPTFTQHSQTHRLLTKARSSLARHRTSDCSFPRGRRCIFTLGLPRFAPFFAVLLPTSQSSKFLVDTQTLALSLMSSFSTILYRQGKQSVPIMHEVFALGAIALDQIPKFFADLLRGSSSSVRNPCVLPGTSSLCFFLNSFCFMYDLCFVRNSSPLFKVIFTLFLHLQRFFNVLFEVLRHCQSVFCFIFNTLHFSRSSVHHFLSPTATMISSTCLFCRRVILFRLLTTPLVMTIGFLSRKGNTHSRHHSIHPKSQV